MSIYETRDCGHSEVVLAKECRVCAALKRDAEVACLVSAAQGWVRLGDALNMAKPQFIALKNALKPFESSDARVVGVMTGDLGPCSQHQIATDDCKTCLDRRGVQTDVPPEYEKIFMEKRNELLQTDDVCCRSCGQVGKHGEDCRYVPARAQDGDAQGWAKCVSCATFYRPNGKAQCLECSRAHPQQAVSKEKK